jgi:hypothetical protein
LLQNELSKFTKIKQNFLRKSICLGILAWDTWLVETICKKQVDPVRFVMLLQVTKNEDFKENGFVLEAIQLNTRDNNR